MGTTGSTLNTQVNNYVSQLLAPKIPEHYTAPEFIDKCAANISREIDNLTRRRPQMFRYLNFEFNWLQEDLDQLGNMTFPLTKELAQQIHNTKEGKQLIQSIIDKITVVQDYYPTTYTIKHYYTPIPGVMDRNLAYTTVTEEFENGIYGIYITFMRVSQFIEL